MVAPAVAPVQPEAYETDVTDAEWELIRPTWRYGQRPGRNARSTCGRASTPCATSCERAVSGACFPRAFQLARPFKLFQFAVWLALGSRLRWRLDGIKAVLEGGSSVAG